ncbi:MAG: carboxypeptidase regulatory-like domain-containing protein [Planctomycetes bacterium]|nr:carboxypeptidase regulatory-like domain-containing protein [Planctomycetota bacterium]
MNAKALVVPFLLAVAAVGGWLALRQGEEPVPQTTTPPNATATGTSSTASAQAGTVETGGQAAAAVAASAADRQAVTPIDPTAGATSAEVLVTGRLVDRAGAPRPGIGMSVHAWPSIDDIELLGPPNRDDDRTTRIKWTTRADGRFEFKLPKRKNGELDVEPAELVMARGTKTVESKKGDHDLGDVVALQSGAVAGVVQDAQGRGVAGVKVSLTIGALGFGGSSSGVSGADGAFRLGKVTGGTWTLRTSSGKFLPTTQEVTLADEEQKTGVVLVVKPGNAVAGQVVDDRGVGVAGMKVGSNRREKSGDVEIERFSGDDATTTDANGFFTLSGLADKTVTVRAFGPGHSAAVAADVAVGTGNLVLQVARVGAIEGVLVAADGAPIANSRIRVTSEGADASMADEFDPLLAGNESTKTAADGTFTLRSVKPGKVTVSAKGDSHRPAQLQGVAVVPAQTVQGVRIVADTGAALAVTVADDTGKPVAGAEVKVERAPAPDAGQGNFRIRAHAVENTDGEVVVGGDDRVGKGTTDADGKVRIGGLPAGDLVVSAAHEKFAPTKALRVTTPKVGTVDAALQLRAPGTAALVVLGTDGAPAAGVEVEVRSVGGDGKPFSTSVVSGDGGKATVAQLAPGEYLAALVRPPARTSIGNAMVFSGSEKKHLAGSQVSFTVVAGEDTKVELRRPVLTRLHGVVTGSDGPAAGCVVELAARDDSGMFAPPGFGSPSTMAGADGTFAFEDVEAGRYEMRYGKRNQLVKATEEIEVAANLAELRHDLQLRVGSLRVQAVAIGGNEPIEKAEVELIRASQAPSAGQPPRRQQRVMVMSLVTTNDEGSGEAPESTTMTMGSQRTFTDEDGFAVVEDVPVGEWTVRLTHKKHAPKELTGKVVAERAQTECGKIELTAAGQLRGRVLDANGKVVRMAMVQTCPAGTENWGEPAFAQGGNYRVTGLAPGKVRVRTQQIGMTPGPWSEPVEAEVKGGETTTLDVQVPAK